MSPRARRKRRADWSGLTRSAGDASASGGSGPEDVSGHGSDFLFPLFQSALKRVTAGVRRDSSYGRRLTHEAEA